MERRMIYPNGNYPERTNLKYERHYNKGSDKYPYKGVKSNVQISKTIVVPDAIPLDYMHLVLLGLFKSFAKRFFNSSYSNCDYYIGKKNYLILLSYLS